MIDKLAMLPLNFPPGKGWTYSISMDIEGYLVEKLSGQTLPDFMRDQIFAPLGVRDTGFYVPAEKRMRFATNYREDEQGQPSLEASVFGEQCSPTALVYNRRGQVNATQTQGWPVHGGRVWSGLHWHIIESMPRLVRAEWARCTAGPIRSSGARWR